MKKIVLYICVFAAIFGSCDRNRKGAASDKGILSDTLQYASGIIIKHFDDYTKIDIKNPWDTSKVLRTYILINRSVEAPDNLPSGTIIRTPIKNIVVYTSVHASIIEQLGSQDDIIAICEPAYLTSKKIKGMVVSGKIADIGESTSPNIEKIIDLGGEVIIASPFEHSGYGAVEKIGIPIIEGADYMETHPLGRCEWIRFYGLLLGKESLADSLFSSTVDNYNNLKELVSTSSTKKPSVIAERKYGSAWFIPGGKSYIATLYEDSGADYIFKDNTEKGSAPLPFETVFSRSIDADIWLMKYTSDKAMRYSDLKVEYPLYERMSAFKNKKIFTCNTIATPYYDDITIHPDFILSDLIFIFHTDLLKNYKPRYFFPMED